MPTPGKRAQARLDREEKEYREWFAESVNGTLFAAENSEGEVL